MAARNKDDIRDIKVNALQSDDPKYLNARVFAGNLPTDKMTKEEFEEKFSKYGPIIACSLHKGYGFVQFENEADALEAVRNENGGLYKGFKIDCNMAGERRRDERRPKRRSSPHFDDRRERFERMDRYDYYGRDFRDRSPSDRFRHPYRDDLRRDDFREPYPDDFYRRRSYPPDADPYDPEFRYRRDPYDHYRDPYYRDDDRRGSEAEILVVNKQQREYAEMIEHRLKTLGLYVEVRVLLEDVTLAQALDDVSRRGCLYAIIVTSQHEIHRSVTVNILHGIPQEHRNMPLDDALNLVARNFDRYVQSSREKGELSIPTLLNLLADNRQLTVSELDKVIRFLQNRRDKLIQAEGGIPPHSNEPNLKPEINPDGILQQHQELKQKILSILNPVVSNSPNQMQPPVKPPLLNPPYRQPWQKNDDQQSAINFDNPNIQKALDNLIQSGPNLLRNLQPADVPSFQNNTPMPPPLFGDVGPGRLNQRDQLPFGVPQHSGSGGGGLLSRPPMLGRPF